MEGAALSWVQSTVLSRTQGSCPANAEFGLYPSRVARARALNTTLWVPPLSARWQRWSSRAVEACGKAEAEAACSREGVGGFHRPLPTPGSEGRQGAPNAGGRQLPREWDGKERAQKQRERPWPCSTAGACTTLPESGGEHRASLLLLCLSRLTNHPDIPKQQLPAIRSSRTHVPISCAPISSSALDLGQTSAPGCSRARLLPPRSQRWAGASPGCGPGGLSSPAAGGRRDPAPWMPALGWEISVREKPEVWWTREQQRLLPSCASCQATKKS